MEINIEESKYAKKAMELFKEGYNCSQAVLLAFNDKLEMDPGTALKLSSSFGGGMGRLGEVCGAVSGMFMIAGVLYGYESPKASKDKMTHYERIRELAGQYKIETSSIVCRELLGLEKGKKPCVQLVGMAAALMEKYILENPY